MGIERLPAAWGGNPLESDEEAILYPWLEARGIKHCHVPNEHSHKRRGVHKGVPDCLIFDRAPSAPGSRGVVIELKRQRDAEPTREQREWLVTLVDLGWLAFVAHGAEPAIKWLTKLGFDQPPCFWEAERLRYRAA